MVGMASVPVHRCTRYALSSPPKIGSSNGMRTARTRLHDISTSDIAPIVSPDASALPPGPPPLDVAITDTKTVATTHSGPTHPRCGRGILTLGSLRCQSWRRPNTLRSLDDRGRERGGA